ncbi:MAG: orotidine-5'-phosphate decarboxylase [Nitrospiria bacterium]
MKNIPLEAKERLILPLDVPSFKAACPLITLLKNHVGLFKVGLTLFIKEGLQVIEQIEDLSGGRSIFLDLKLYDTPMQVGRAAAVLRAEVPKVRFLTVHTSGGLRVVKAVVEAMRGGTEVLGVTALTSQSPVERAGQAGAIADSADSIDARVLALADIAKEAGAAGVVASGHEARHLKGRFGDALKIVTPGIRPDWSEVGQDDQRRTMTPKAAISNGADYLVIGRPIYDDPDPRGAAEKIAAEIESA